MLSERVGLLVLLSWHTRGQRRAFFWQLGNDEDGQERATGKSLFCRLHLGPKCTYH